MPTAASSDRFEAESRHDHKYEELPDYLSFKHRYLLFALDSGIMLDLLTAIREHRKIELELMGGKNGKMRRAT
jgi:hypothetical protein